MNVNDGTEPCPHCGAAHHPSAIKAYHQGRNEGAAIAFGIMGMVQAIRDHHMCRLCRGSLTRDIRGRVCLGCDGPPHLATLSPGLGVEDKKEP
jgi:hypothetical protein